MTTDSVQNCDCSHENCLNKTFPWIVSIRNVYGSLNSDVSRKVITVSDLHVHEFESCVRLQLLFMQQCSLVNFGFSDGGGLSCHNDSKEKQCINL
jgi:hypothetical protein